MLDNIKIKALPGEKPDYIPLSILGNQTSSPLRALVAAVVDETQLTREPPDPNAGNADNAQAAAATGNLLTQKLKSQTSGLQRIGIDLALKKASGRPGDATTVAVPGANIEAQFKDYAAVATGDPKAPVDLLVDGFNQVYQNLFLAANNPSQAQQANAAAQTAVSGLALTSSRFPAALRRIVSSAVNDLEGNAAGSSLSQLNQALAANVTSICQRFTADLYPFAPNSKRDLPMADFSRLFAPNGVLDKFFAENLAPLADLSTDPWTWKQDSALGRDLSNAALREFQRAAEIRDAFFPPGAIAPQVTLTISQTSLNPAAQSVLQSINGTVILSQQLGNLPQTLQWPGGGGGAVTISFSPELPGRESSVSVPGDWALMRVLARNTVSRRGDTLRVTITVGGRDVTYSIQVGTVLNPFFLSALSDFSCPTGL
jgi:type VI secretion system protein ImpL